MDSICLQASEFQADYCLSLQLWLFPVYWENILPNEFNHIFSDIFINYQSFVTNTVEIITAVIDDWADLFFIYFIRNHDGFVRMVSDLEDFDPYNCF